ncbi:MAG TPA: hypothetical protein VFR62_04375 [Gemmatimonadales bacterium]|nr:hypothetical protein [Gemmatimonadales bacterium]
MRTSPSPPLLWCAGWLLASTLHAASNLPRIVWSPAGVATSPDASHLILITVLGTSEETCHAPLFKNPGPLQAGRILIEGHVPDILAPCTGLGWSQTVIAPRLPAGTYPVEVLLDGQPYATAQLSVEPAPTALHLQLADGEQLAVEVAWTHPGTGHKASAFAALTSEQTGHFWFQSPVNAEVSVKVVDGRGVNGRLWLFIAPLTTLGFEVRVSQCHALADPPVACGTVTRVYSSPPGRKRTIIDTNVEPF